MRSLFDFLIGGALGWNRMPDDFERFIYPDFASPSPPTRALRGAADRALPRRGGRDPPLFPRPRAPPRAGIFSAIQQQMAPAPLAFLMRPMRGVSARPERPRRPATISSAISVRASSRRCSPPSGATMGLPPKQSAFALHALVVGSYLNGGWFPGRRRRTHRAHDRAGNRGGGRRDPRLPGGDRDRHRERPRRRGARRSTGAAGADRRRLTARLSSSPTSARRSPTSDCCRPTARSAGGPPSSAPLSPR